MAATTTVTLLNKYGLHQRPAMKVIETTTKFKSDVKFIRDDKICNGKSIIDVMMLAAECGSTLEVHAEGEDEQDALRAIEELFAQKFYLNEE